MSDESPSVSTWISELKRGNSMAAQQLWNAYFERLLHVARAKLSGWPRAAEDEEDAVLAAMGSVFERARRGEFPELTDRSDLWALLVTVTARKVANQIAKETALKRGGGRVKAFSALDSEAWLEPTIGDQPRPDMVDGVIASFRELMQSLDGELNLIAQRKLEGFSNREIAKEFSVDPRTIDRKLGLIRIRCVELLEE